MSWEIQILIAIAIILILYVVYRYFTRKKMNSSKKTKKSKKSKKSRKNKTVQNSEEIEDDDSDDEDSDSDDENEDEDEEEDDETIEDIKKRADKLYQQVHTQFLNGLNQDEFLNIAPSEDALTYIKLQQLYNMYEERNMDPQNITPNDFVKALVD